MYFGFCRSLILTAVSVFPGNRKSYAVAFDVALAIKPPRYFVSKLLYQRGYLL